MQNPLPTTKQCPDLRALVGSELRDQLQEECLCPPGQLIAPQGRLPQKKLALMRRFEAACPGWRAQPLTPANLDAAYSLERRWQSQQEQPAQLEFVRRCFREYAQRQLTGCLLWDGRQPVGYAMAMLTGETHAAILVLRALPTPAGVTAVLYRETALLLGRQLPALAWVNLGFLGGEQERQNRLSYQPLVDKDSLRRLARRQRAAITPRERCLWDSGITLQLLALPQYRAARRVYVFLSTPGEVSTQAVVGHALLLGKEVAVPRCQGGIMDFCPFTDYRTLEQDRMGIWQPPASAPMVQPMADGETICIVPALRVDCLGYRLGYGGGYYDRFLAGYRGFSVAVAYDFMVTQQLPRESFDRPVDAVATPQGVRIIPHKGEPT